jgi:hypothetical protein
VNVSSCGVLVSIDTLLLCLDLTHTLFVPVNVFAGIQNNPLFCSILLITAVLQVLIVEFGSVAFHVAQDGLNGRMWALCLGIGATSLPVQQVINVLYRGGLEYKGYRMSRRRKREGALTTQQANGGHNSSGRESGHFHAE